MTLIDKGIFLILIVVISCNDWQVFGEFKVSEISRIYKLAEDAIKDTEVLSAAPKLIADGLQREYGF